MQAAFSVGGASEAVAAEGQDQDRFKKREKRSLSLKLS